MILEGKREADLVKEYQKLTLEAGRLQAQYQNKFSENIAISLSGNPVAMAKSDQELSQAHRAYQLAEIAKNNVQAVVANRVLEALEQGKCIEGGAT